MLQLMINLHKKFSSRARSWRAHLFLKELKPKFIDRVLDLGSGNGSYFYQIIKPRKNVFISDINRNLLLQGKKLFGYNTIVLNVEKTLPFQDNYVDVLFCSSLIEHVTGDKSKVITFESNHSFSTYAYKHQKKLAKEIRRISKSYFVQTPHKYFPIESHTWMPCILIFLPRKIQIQIIIFLNKYWPKKTYPDWNLLTVSQMKDLFPDAEIHLERSFGFVKSIMAIKKRKKEI